jgi:2'-5' RNA ligase
MWRLFIALELPRTLIDSIARTQNDLKRSFSTREAAHVARWVKPDGIHLTLKFLGDVPTEQVGALKLALSEAVRDSTSISLTAEGLGCFPNARQPRVLWVGLRGDLDALMALWQSVEARIAPLGYPAEERGFSPHLTLARAARNASRNEIAALGEIAGKATVGTLGSWRAESVSLMRSQLRPEGAIYTQVAKVMLEPDDG